MRIAFLVLVLILLGASCTDSSSSSRSSSSSQNLNCSDLRKVGRAGIAAGVSNPIYEKDMCWKDGPHAIYEAFVKSSGAVGRPAHYKFTFKTLSARGGIKEICQDARTGVWECAP